MGYIWSLLTEIARKVSGLGERFKTAENIRAARGITLLREWLSAQQQAQFDATKSFEVTGSDSGKRYRILYGTETNIQELDEAGRPVAGWCFIPSGQLVAGDVMLAQKIALETDEEASLKIAKGFSVRNSQISGDNDHLRAH
jgi:hypothetical protein